MGPSGQIYVSVEPSEYIRQPQLTITFVQFLYISPVEIRSIPSRITFVQVCQSGKLRTRDIGERAEVDRIDDQGKLDEDPETKKKRNPD